MIRRIQRLILLSGALTLSLLPVAQAQTQPQGESEIDRLMMLFYVSDLMHEGAEQGAVGPTYLKQSSQRQACLMDIATGSDVLEEHRDAMRIAFSTSDSRRRAIDMFSSEAGRKIIDWARRPDGTLDQIKAQLGDAGYAEFARYLKAGGADALQTLFAIPFDKAKFTRLIADRCPAH